MAKQKRAPVEQSANSKQKEVLEKKKVISKDGLREIALQQARKNGSLKFQSSPQEKQKNRNSRVRLSNSSIIAQLVGKEQINCPICLDIMVRPFKTSCGHTFCFSCGEKAILIHHNCCICREPAQLPTLPSEKSVTSTIIKSHVLQLEEKEKKQYE